MFISCAVFAEGFCMTWCIYIYRVRYMKLLKFMPTQYCYCVYLYICKTRYLFNMYMYEYIDIYIRVVLYRSWVFGLKIHFSRSIMLRLTIAKKKEIDFFFCIKNTSAVFSFYWVIISLFFIYEGRHSWKLSTCIHVYKFNKSRVIYVEILIKKKIQYAQ